VLEEVGQILAVVAIVVVWIAISAFFALWIHRAEGNRALTMGLYLVFGGVAWFGFLFGAGSNFRSWREGEGFTERSTTWMVVGLAIGLALIPHTRRLLARVIPFDPNSKPDMVALAILSSTAAVSLIRLFFDPEVETTATYTELIAQAVVFVALAFLAVGVYIKRTPREALQRLGLVRPTPRQVGIAIAMVFVAFAVAIVSSLLVQVLQPDAYERIEENMETLTEQLDSVWGALAIGLSAGIGEEVLFRGAIQPKFGLIFTSLVFALLHIQYEASFITVGVFAAGIVFGLERKYLNTTCCIITHALYNIIAVLLTS
jgi:membrane protease YdiL (CAAX protease family)